MNEQLEHFCLSRKNYIESNSTNDSLQKAALDFNTESNKAFYSYNFSWMGRHYIAYPQEMIAMQEII